MRRFLREHPRLRPLKNEEHAALFTPVALEIEEIGIPFKTIFFIGGNLPYPLAGVYIVYPPLFGGLNYIVERVRGGS